MNAYIYAADLYCEDCGKAIRERLNSLCPICGEIITIIGRTADDRLMGSCGDAFQKEKWEYPKDPDDESSYDSDEYPKGPYPDGGGESDSPWHCGAGSDCLNAIELSDGTKVGAWLENELTTDGVDYVREAIQGGGEVAGMWADFYRDYDLQPRGN